MQVEQTLTTSFPRAATPVDPLIKRTVVVEEASEKESIWDKVFRIATTALKVVAAVGLFVANSTFYCTGILFSVIFPYEASFALNRIKSVWLEMSVLAACVAVSGAFLAMHYTLSVGAFFVGAEVGLNATNF